MNIVLTADDLARFSQSTRDEILRRFVDEVGSLPVSALVPAPDWRDEFEGVHVANLEDITHKYIGRWMERASDEVRAGARVIAEHGPVVNAHQLTELGIDIRKFQSATTRRTRALTGDRNAYFLAWNNWSGMDDPDGKYAVSPITHQSLRRYFGLPV
ncbi:hypothetical protein [Aurantiacibacter spongiae]|uniref:Uncharacterized protein n=1 Tax=Aurantiacibacter spongiae TaxID=2488860 RepID=A0A3N5DKA8_9SPHN|nr:hypothetical protein [Aurantiacibacter spongiae]RPF72142.1 hypothetical protein EG799_11315 [Aurantiacibacter spongiae]